MQHSGKKRIIALVVVCYSLFVAILFFSKLRDILHVEEWSMKDNISSVMSSEDAMADNTSAWKIRPVCRRPGLRILYFVHTAPKNTKERRWIRQTLGDPTIESEMNSAIVFFVGEAPELNDHEEVLEEASREGDLVVLNFTDTYMNLTYKFMQGAKWVADNCLLDQTAVVVKLDDDVLVNLPALSAYLKSGVMALTGIHCRVWKGAKPFRSKKSKWYVSNDVLPGRSLPALLRWTSPDYATVRIVCDIRRFK
ncbi:hypothetical protein HPB50_006402 [Hyalomma asiaticum]|uniref:Uncharacterized protein n=1 Tax=Hyalomma asiaticum TaxID=266040 RepID=A0ACB7SFD5_HYAAI|nr:hypothetical protein HPB50_006402 [Hyalomma asiaticum]